MGESLIYATFAMLVAMALVELLLLPCLNAFLHRAIVLDYWHAPLLASIVAVVLLVGMLAARTQQDTRGTPRPLHLAPLR